MTSTNPEEKLINTNFSELKSIAFEVVAIMF